MSAATGRQAEKDLARRTGARRGTGTLRYMVVHAVATTAPLIAASAAYDALCLLVSFKSYELDASIGFAPTLLLLLSGEREQVVTPGAPLQIPFVWLLGQAVLLAQVCLSVTRPARGLPVQTLLRSSSARAWWLCTAGTVGILVALRTCVSLFVCAAFSLAAGLPAQDFSALSKIFGPAASSLTSGDALALVLLASAGTLVVAQLCCLACLLLTPFWSFVASVAFLFVSLFSTVPVLAGDWSMLLRCSWFTAGGIKPGAGIAVGLALGLFLSGLGAAVASRGDLV